MIAALALLGVVGIPAAECREPQTQSAMTICAGRDFEQADARLNRQWPLTLAAMKAYDRDITADDHRPTYSAALLDAQRAWLRFRDAQCLSEGYYARGGSMEPMLVAACKAALTEDRIKQLRQLAESK